MRHAIAIAAATLSLAAHGQAWSPAGATSAGRTFLDMSSIRPQGTVIKAWDKSTYKDWQQNQFPSFYYQTTKSLVYYDCKSGTYATKQVVYYDDSEGVGTIVHTQAFTDAQLYFQDPIPGSIGHGLLLRVCGMSRR